MRWFGAGGLRAPVTAMSLLRMKRQAEKIVMVTCYDYPSASHVLGAGVDVALVGDSLGMVALGYDTTQPVTLDEMVHHCKAVRRGVGAGATPRPLVVCDLPFGSYEESPGVALRSAVRLVKEGGADCVKLEGGAAMAPTVAKLVGAGVAVMGHVGLTPQAVGVLGGFRAQGRTAVKAAAVLDDALALQDAGAFAVVVECVPAVVGTAVAAALDVPAIGIGAGVGLDGQVLVYHDLLGALAHPHHARHVPKFVRPFAQLGAAAHGGLSAFRDEVRASTFPDDASSPYAMPDAERAKFEASLEERAPMTGRSRENARRRNLDADEYETINLY